MTPFNFDVVDEKFENERDGEFDPDEKSDEEKRSEKNIKEQEDNKFFK